MAVKLLIESFEQIRDLAFSATVEEDVQPALRAFSNLFQILTRGFTARDPGMRQSCIVVMAKILNL